MARRERQAIVEAQETERQALAVKDFTLRKLAEGYVEYCERKGNRSASQTDRLLRTHVFKMLGAEPPVGELKRGEVLAKLDKLAARRVLCLPTLSPYFTPAGS